ncbi:hypothetical protein JD82_04971 [Prauserella rugosa]|uniref:Uncharacterized protein n=2 Tax=Prauserella rugosa TaxID=43354 RepID=A0A660C8C7_9PSEU|nr:hypothetical protein JD82_04971 [Prauserella rugosa]
MTAPQDPTPEQLIAEMLDRRHRRASVSDGETMMIDPGKVLDNIEDAMRRLDVDIDTPVSIEDDVVTLAELTSLIKNLHMGPSLITHVVNTAMAILTARYPAELVTLPLPVEFDLRELHPIRMGDRPHQVAKDVFNRRIAAGVDLDSDDIDEVIDSLEVPDRIHVFVAVFYMYGSKLGALKHRTGID